MSLPVLGVHSPARRPDGNGDVHRSFEVGCCDCSWVRPDFSPSPSGDGYPFLSPGTEKNNFKTTECHGQVTALPPPRAQEPK
eukprot:11451665-Karenia_brevis.AAC.1